MKHLLVSAALLLYSTIVFATEQAETEAVKPITFLQVHDAEARDILAQTAGDSLLAKQRQQIKGHINSAFDFAELSKLALGEHWDGRSQEERAQFVGTFGDIIAEQNFNNFVDYYRDGKIVYQGQEVDRDKAVVRAQAPAKREAVDITYLLHRKEGQWRVYDLVIDDASTVEGYRKRYSRYLKKKPFGQLMERLDGQRARLLAQQ